MILCALTLIPGCSDQTTIYHDQLQDGLLLKNSPSEIGEAIHYEHAGVLDIFETPSISEPTGKSIDTAGDFPLTVIATVDPPKTGTGSVLTASHVVVDGDYAYVAYNTQGETYSGAVDVVNVADPHQPRVTSRLLFGYADINSVAVSNGWVYAVGGLDAETSLTATSNSFVARIPVLDGQLSTEPLLYGFQQGYTATDVLVSGDRVLVSSGRDGSITAYNTTDLGILSEAYVSDARSIAATPSGIAVLDAGAGVRLWDAGFAETALIPIETDLGEGAKRTLSIGMDRAMVAESDLGAGIYDLGTGQLLEHIPIPIHPEGVDVSDVVTNAVTANESALFMANGGAGLSLSEIQIQGVSPVGILELEGSVNYVASKSDYAFAATGSTGLQIIRLNRPSESLDSRCADLPGYTGGTHLIVTEGETRAFRGEKRLKTLTVGGELLLCGSWTVLNHVNIQAGGTLELSGIFAVGRNSSQRNITVNEGSRLRIEGDVTIYGDLILQEGAVVEFLGAGSVIDVFGEVKYNGPASISGNFRDVRGAF